MNRYCPALTALVACLAAIAWTATAVAQDSPADLDLEEKLDELLPGSGAEDMNARRGPQSEWQEICFQLGAPGNEAKLGEACTLMAARIGPTTPLEARIWLLKQLERHGGAGCVTAVSAQLSDPEVRVRDAGRRALANNPAAQAGKRLREALTVASNADDRIALVNALVLLPLLGRIGGAKALDAIRKALSSKDDARVEAGILALTNWPTVRGRV